jgi:site-specific recombinase XerD
LTTAASSEHRKKRFKLRPYTWTNDLLLIARGATSSTALAAWIAEANLPATGYLFPSRRHAAAHLSARQYARIVKRWIGLIGADPAADGTHSLRHTKATLIYRRTHNLRAVQLLLGHRKLESTVRYLGIEVDDALEMAERTEC